MPRVSIGGETQRSIIFKSYKSRTEETNTRRKQARVFQKNRVSATTTTTAIIAATTTKAATTTTKATTAEKKTTLPSQNGKRRA